MKKNEEREEKKEKISGACYVGCNLQLLINVPKVVGQSL
jgi:hypothetical protein